MLHEFCSALSCGSCTLLNGLNLIQRKTQEWLRVANAIRYHWLQQPPARIWADADVPADRNAGIRAALLDRCRKAEEDAGGVLCHQRLILCNLFSLEGDRDAVNALRHALQRQLALYHQLCCHPCRLL